MISISATTRHVIPKNSNIIHEEVCCVVLYGVYNVNGNWKYCHYKNTMSAEDVHEIQLSISNILHEIYVPIILLLYELKTLLEIPEDTSHVKSVTIF